MLCLIFNFFYCCRYTSFDFWAIATWCEFIIKTHSFPMMSHWIESNFIFVSFLLLLQRKRNVRFNRNVSQSLHYSSNRCRIETILISNTKSTHGCETENEENEQEEKKPLESQVEWMQSIAAIHQKPLNIVNKPKRAKHQKWHYFYRCHFMKHECKCLCCNISSVFFCIPSTFSHFSFFLLFCAHSRSFTLVLILHLEWKS